MRRFLRLWVTLVLLASSTLITGCRTDPRDIQEAQKIELGLMTSLPIYWQESEEFDDLLNADAEPNWVRATLEKRNILTPIDSLSTQTLAPLDNLLLAQPRALSPDENVALDAWVRKGGRLLLFADPLLTQHSHFALGDPRAPQAVALLSPILAHWGLELTFDERQSDGEREADVFGYPIPVDLPGKLRLAQETVEGKCELGQDGISAYCSIGKGSVWVIADAAVLDTSVAAEEVRSTQLDFLVQRSFNP